MQLGTGFGFRTFQHLLFIRCSVFIMRMSLIFYAVDAAVPRMQFNPINLQILQKRLSAERKLRCPKGPFIDQTIFCCAEPFAAPLEPATRLLLLIWWHTSLLLSSAWAFKSENKPFFIKNVGLWTPRWQNFHQKKIT